MADYCWKGNYFNCSTKWNQRVCHPWRFNLTTFAFDWSNPLRKLYSSRKILQLDWFRLLLVGESGRHNPNNPAEPAENRQFVNKNHPGSKLTALLGYLRFVAADPIDPVQYLPKPNPVVVSSAAPPDPSGQPILHSANQFALKDPEPALESDCIQLPIDNQGNLCPRQRSCVPQEHSEGVDPGAHQGTLRGACGSVLDPLSLLPRWQNLTCHSHTPLCWHWRY